MSNLMVHAAGRYARRKGWIDARYGFALMRSRDVPVGKKVIALAIGALVTSLIYLLELAPEGLLGAVLPLLGLGFDLALDGLEFLVLPLLIACVVLPWLGRDGQ